MGTILKIICLKIKVCKKGLNVSITYQRTFKFISVNLINICTEKIHPSQLTWTFILLTKSNWKFSSTWQSKGLPSTRTKKNFPSRWIFFSRIWNRNWMTYLIQFKMHLLGETWKSMVYLWSVQCSGQSCNFKRLKSPILNGIYWKQHSAALSWQNK